MHVYSSRFPRGMFTSRRGTQMAAVQEFSMRVIGEGGHASTPHMTADPIPIACEIVTALQNTVTRQFDVFDPVERHPRGRAVLRERAQFLGEGPCSAQ